MHSSTFRIGHVQVIVQTPSSTIELTSPTRLSGQRMCNPILVCKLPSLIPKDVCVYIPHERRWLPMESVQRVGRVAYATRITNKLAKHDSITVRVRIDDDEVTEGAIGIDILSEQIDS